MSVSTVEHDPVLIRGEVSLTKTEPRYITTRTQTFILPANDTNGPQLIRPRTKQECHTIIMPMPVPGGTNAGYGWISASPTDCERQKGCLVRGDATGPIDLIGQNELYAMADPGSTGAALYLAVYTEIEGTN